MHSPPGLDIQVALSGRAPQWMYREPSGSCPSSCTPTRTQGRMQGKRRKKIVGVEIFHSRCLGDFSSWDACTFRSDNRVPLACVRSQKIVRGPKSSTSHAERPRPSVRGERGRASFIYVSGKIPSGWLLVAPPLRCCARRR